MEGLPNLSNAYSEWTAAVWSVCFSVLRWLAHENNGSLSLAWLTTSFGAFYTVRVEAWLSKGVPSCPGVPSPIALGTPFSLF